MTVETYSQTYTGVARICPDECDYDILVLFGPDGNPLTDANGRRIRVLTEYVIAIY